MKFKTLLFLPLLLITSCDQNLIKDVTIDGTSLPKTFEGTEVKGFSLNTFNFTYFDVDVDENNNFVIKPNGYIKSLDSIPYSNMRLSTDRLEVTVGDVNFNTQEMINPVVISYDESKSFDGEYVYYLKGYKRVVIKNVLADSISLNPIYFYADK